MISIMWWYCVIWLDLHIFSNIMILGDIIEMGLTESALIMPFSCSPKHLDGFIVFCIAASVPDWIYGLKVE